MKKLVANFPTQLHEALIIGQNYRFQTPQKAFTNVVLSGLGGSGIGGSIVQNFVGDEMKVPFIVNKDYALPAFVGKNSLVIISSYSGNTEETLAAMQQAIKAKATVVCITSGGKVSEISKKKSWIAFYYPQVCRRVLALAIRSRRFYLFLLILVSSKMILKSNLKLPSNY